MKATNSYKTKALLELSPLIFTVFATLIFAIVLKLWSHDPHERLLEKKGPTKEQKTSCPEGLAITGQSIEIKETGLSGFLIIVNNETIENESTVTLHRVGLSDSCNIYSTKPNVEKTE